MAPVSFQLRNYHIEDSRFLFSDDGGKQWRASPITDPAPMHKVFPSGQLIELDDGTLVVPWYGYNTWMAGLLDENTFWVWANNEALIYRRVRE